MSQRRPLQEGARDGVPAQAEAQVQEDVGLVQAEVAAQEEEAARGRTRRA